jgi:hypothetical protein
MNGAKVDEVMCKTLNPPASGDAMFKDVATIKGCTLFTSSNEASNLHIMHQVHADTGATKAVPTSAGSELAPYAHYNIPEWSGIHGLHEDYLGLEVYMVSEKNYLFNMKEQSPKNGPPTWSNPRWTTSLRSCDIFLN